MNQHAMHSFYEITVHTQFVHKFGVTYFRTFTVYGPKIDFIRKHLRDLYQFKEISLFFFIKEVSRRPVPDSEPH